MFCAACGTQFEDGDRFCKQCGNALQSSQQVQPQSYGYGPADRWPKTQKPRVPAPQRPQRPPAPAKNPYRDQIAQLRLQLKEQRMQLRELNQRITNTRSNYFELDSFVQRGPLRNIGRMIEGAQLFNPYQQRKQMQDQIALLERQLLQLEKAQEQWRLEQQQRKENNQQ